MHDDKYVLLIERLKYSAAPNIKIPTKHSDKQGVKQVQATADVHSVLFVLECMSEDIL